MAENIFTTTECADFLAQELTPQSTKPRTRQTIARLCRDGAIPGAYMLFGDWCIPKSGMVKYVRAVRRTGIMAPPEPVAAKNGGQPKKSRGKRK